MDQSPCVFTSLPVKSVISRLYSSECCWGYFCSHLTDKVKINKWVQWQPLKLLSQVAVHIVLQSLSKLISHLKQDSYSANQLQDRQRKEGTKWQSWTNCPTIKTAACGLDWIGAGVISLCEIQTYCESHFQLQMSTLIWMVPMTT